MRANPVSEFPIHTIYYCCIVHFSHFFYITDKDNLLGLGDKFGLNTITSAVV